MTLIELKQLIAKKLGIALSSIGAEDFKAYGVRFHYLGSSYRATKDLTVEKVDGACLLTDDDARHIEKLLRCEEWDGEGLPPVGADVQCICNQFPSEGQEKLLGKVLYSGEYTVLLTYKTNEQHHVPVESVLMTKHWLITPIRSEADKKREIGVLSLARADPTVGRFEYGEKMSDGRLIGYAWYELYDKIAAGEVAGIRID
ncbi:TPA: hypothetical protein QCI36_000601 [Enterobacter ludwigii]|nr:hypothetical protein [Enterobacter ludwigii]